MQQVAAKINMLVDIIYFIESYNYNWHNLAIEY